jgi:DNA-binding transcriptional MerR regulator
VRLLKKKRPVDHEHDGSCINLVDNKPIKKERAGFSNPTYRKYFRIGEVAELVGEKPHVLRFWESEFPSIRPRKSPSGQRVYAQQDVELLLRIRSLLKERGFTIEGARRELRAWDDDSFEGITAGYRRSRELLVAIRAEAVSILAELEEGL